MHATHHRPPTLPSFHLHVSTVPINAVSATGRRRDLEQAAEHQDHPARRICEVEQAQEAGRGALNRSGTEEEGRKVEEAHGQEGGRRLPACMRPGL
mmetsp:Transcript_625/g.1258  ORF Transcript_625/g.1258 Transcript_625/m.1258 type:complete len:96 (+) Transcript_625:257-544(+)|eukprot:CAMPEP_0182828424 /NCGR_PEP_ID=MMETSP0006_2-20121128/17469_1 /TAXON_ID=97485 /ORGANISM="Prymnesium parvum, Strain Texoma1" /LENGTH=95 /DNA_ID=CAMNT_0024955793 /DNA_START=315 /DNA_END=602 /DNA_ORIENTATION=+